MEDFNSHSSPGGIIAPITTDGPITTDVPQVAFTTPPQPVDMGTALTALVTSIDRLVVLIERGYSTMQDELSRQMFARIDTAIAALDKPTKTKKRGPKAKKRR